MKKTSCVLLFFCFFLIASHASSQESSWEKWNWLIGEWVGEGSGQPGSGDGMFSLAADLDNKVLIRKNHSFYPATKDKPAIKHDDLMIIYPGAASPKAIYFDNEGHVINYVIILTDNKIVFVSEKVQSMPVFRLTYSMNSTQSIAIKFEMSQDGETFKTYIEGSARKK